MVALLPLKAVLLAVLSLVALSTVSVNAGDCKTGWRTLPRDSGNEMTLQCSIDAQGDVNDNNYCQFNYDGVEGESNYYYKAKPPKQLGISFYGNGKYEARVEISFTKGPPAKLTIPAARDGCFAQDWDRDIVKVMLHGP